MYMWGKGRAAGRVGSDFSSAIAGRVGSGQRSSSSGRVGSNKSNPWTTLRDYIIAVEVTGFQDYQISKFILIRYIKWVSWLCWSGTDTAEILFISGRE